MAVSSCENAPIIELFIIDDFTIVRSPIETFGPTIESLISQSAAMLTGSIIMVFLKSYTFLPVS